FNDAYRLLKIRAEMELGRYADALGTLDVALKRFPNNIEIKWVGIDVYRFNNDPERAKAIELEILQIVRQAPWRYNEASSRIIVGRLLLKQGMDPKRVLDGLYNEVKKQLPNFVHAHLASGELALEKS